MYVFLTGGSGFVGSHILARLLDVGHTVRALVRGEAPSELKRNGVDVVRGSVTERESLDGLLSGCDAAIHLVGIIDEHPSKGVTFEAVHDQGTRHVVDAAVQAGIGTFIQMSANGARPDGVSAYQTSKWAGEEHVRNAGFAHWTIFRPSTIFGDPGPDHPEFVKQIATTLVDPFPILPVFGDGQFELQPVHISEVADAFVQALTLEAANGQSYCVAGQNRLTYVDLLDHIARGLGHAPKPKLKQPLWLVRPAVHTLGKIGLLPISPDQFEMLVEGNTCDPTAFYRDFDVEPVPFTPDHLTYVQAYT